MTHDTSPLRLEKVAASVPLAVASTPVGPCASPPPAVAPAAGPSLYSSRTRPAAALNAYRRLRCETVPMTIRIGDGEHRLAVCLAVDDDLRLRELNFVTRGKIGQGLDDMLTELGIQLSRIIQGRDPETGEARP